MVVVEPSWPRQLALMETGENVQRLKTQIEISSFTNLLNIPNAIPLFKFAKIVTPCFKIPTKLHCISCRTSWQKQKLISDHPCTDHPAPTAPVHRSQRRKGPLLSVMMETHLCVDLGFDFDPYSVITSLNLILSYGPGVLRWNPAKEAKSLPGRERTNVQVKNSSEIWRAVAPSQR